MTEALSKRDYEDFLRARIIFWKTEAKKTGSQLSIPATHQIEITPDSSSFGVSSAGPIGIVGILEDDNETGWFYLYEPLSGLILNCTPVYNRVCASVEQDDVDVVWSADNQTCAVAVWGQFYAFLGISNNVRMHRPIQDKDTDGFYFDEWPDGFQHFLLKEDNKH
jgi:hypothetical protein